MLVALNWFGAKVVPKQLKDILKSDPFVFNPSYVEFGDIHYLAVRIYDPKLKSIISKIYFWGHGIELTPLDLSVFFKTKLNINKVADTKLFIMNNEVWGTFNTGYEEKQNNQLILFKIEDFRISNYYNCSYKDRLRVEKNWAFYYYNNDIYALYSLNHSVVLKATAIHANDMVFDNYFSDSKVNFGAYTIGTPLAYNGGKYIFIAHRKITRKGKRLYLGKPFTFQHSEAPQLLLHNTYLIHSIRSLFGIKHKFNRFLISCTYFSGIHISKNKAIISYGVNDASWNIVKLNIRKLWR